MKPKGTCKRTIKTKVKTTRYEWNDITRNMIEADEKTLLPPFVQKYIKKLTLRKYFFKALKPTTLFGPVGFLSKYGFSSGNTRKRVFQQVNLFKVFHRYSKLLELYQLPKYTQYCVYMQLVCRLLGVEKAL